MVFDQERTAALEAALESERKQLSHATQTLEAVHVEAGIHEAQEMVQLRMEVTALTEEVEFLRSRQAKLHEEEHRLQMVAEMNKRLGTNVSKFELEAIRSQVASLTEEAERVQKHNAQLQAEAKKQATDAQSVVQLHDEIAAFQKANDNLESEMRKRDRHMASLKDQVTAANSRIQLLQRQLALSHRRVQSHGVAATHVADDDQQPQQPQSGRPGGGGGGGGWPKSEDDKGLRKLPLLWDAETMDSPSGAKGTAPVSEGERVGERAPLGVLHSSQQAHVGLAPPSAVGADARSRASVGKGGAVTQRAVTLHDEVASEPIRIEFIPPVAPRLVAPFPRDACRGLRVRDNTKELAAAQAWKEAEEMHGVQLLAALKRQADADAQELRVVRSGLASRMLHARTAKLGTLKHYRMLGLMRALCKWGLLLELEGSYNAALMQAAHLFEEQAGTLGEVIADSQQRTVQTLLIQPQMLGELGEMRRKLQDAYSEAEGLRNGLRELCDTNANSSKAAVEWHSEVNSSKAMRLRLALPSPPPAARVAAILDQRAAMRRVAEDREASLERDAMRLQLRIVLRQWRVAKRTLSRQGLLLRQLSAQRNEELEAAALQSTMMRSARFELEELKVERETWRKQSGEQADVIAAAIASTARTHAKHKEEVALLSEKLYQVLEEKEGLRLICESQASDLKVLSEEMVRRLHPVEGP